MNTKRGKKGYIISYGDWFKGMLIGVIVGGAIVYLFMTGLLKVPSGFGVGKETAKMIVPILPVLFRKN
ncbi:hypothetical protein HYU15_01080 [Candidatus Woesearchaeota archaeon]|nr:hypothetical protein [Candidatus Woesearchaeota archaeon]